MEAHAYIRGRSRSREDLLALKKMCLENNVVMHAGLTSCESMGISPVIEPDRAFFDKMAAGGKLVWLAGGERQKGLKYLKWAENAYK